MQQLVRMELSLPLILGIAMNRIFQQPKNVAEFRAVVGALEMWSGVVTVAVTLDSGTFSNVPTGTVIVNSLFLVFGGLQFAAGFGLLRGETWGFVGSLLLQGIQVPVISLNGFQYCIAPLAAGIISASSAGTLGIDFTLRSQLVVQWSATTSWLLGVNLPPLFMLLGIRRPQVRSAE